MNVIEELAKKHQGTYTEELKKTSSMPSGSFTFHPQKGIFIIDGTKYSINIKAVGGAAQTAEPYRIKLHLNKDYLTRLEIFPKTNFNKILDFFSFRPNPTISEKINKQFSFKGNKGLISKLGTDNNFCEKIKDEKIYIVLGKKNPKQIVLSPAHGIDSIDQLEKYLSILKIIEKKIRNI